MWNRTRREWLCLVGAVGVAGIAGCSSSEDDSSSEEPTAEDETDGQTESDGETETEEETETESGQTPGPAAAVDQFRVALNQGNAERYNEVLHEEGEIEPIEEGELGAAENLEYIDVEVEEISPSSYESRTGQAFDRQQQEAQLSDIGATDFAIVWWDERFRIDQGVPRDSETAVLLYQLDSEWLLHEFIYELNRIAVDAIDQPTPPFENSPTGVVEQFYISASTGDADAVNEALYPDQGEVSPNELQNVDRLVAETEQVSIEEAAEVLSFPDVQDLETVVTRTRDRGADQAEFVVVRFATEDRIERAVVLTVMEGGNWFIFRTDLEGAGDG